jgi:hypothetical protein
VHNSVTLFACRYVLNKYGTTLDDVEGAVEAQRRAYEAAHNEELPLGDRLAIRLAFSYLLQYSAAGRRPSAAALNSAADTVIAAYSNGVGAASATASGDSVITDGPRGIFATTAAVAKRAGGRSAEAASVAARKGMEMLQKIPLPILSRSTDDEESAAAEEQENQQKQQYVLTQAEERLVQVRSLECCCCCYCLLVWVPSRSWPSCVTAVGGSRLTVFVAAVGLRLRFHAITFALASGSCGTGASDSNT